MGDRVVAGGGDPPPDATRSAFVTDPRFNYRTMGFAGSRTGGYAEYTLAEAWALQAIPDAVSDAVAALTEPCSVAVHAVRRSAVKLGDTVGVHRRGAHRAALYAGRPRRRRDPAARLRARALPARSWPATWARPPSSTPARRTSSSASSD